MEVLLNMPVRKSGKSWAARINWRDTSGKLHQMEKIIEDTKDSTSKNTQI